MMATWFLHEKHNYVAVIDSEVLATFRLRTNQPGLGDGFRDADYPERHGHSKVFAGVVLGDRDHDRPVAAFAVFSGVHYIYWNSGAKQTRNSSSSPKFSLSKKQKLSELNREYPVVFSAQDIACILKK